MTLVYYLSERSELHDNLAAFAALMSEQMFQDDPHEMRYYSAIDSQAFHDLVKEIAVLEECMNTKQAEYKTDIGKLAEGMAKRNTCLIIIGLVMTLSCLGLYIRTFFAGS